MSEEQSDRLRILRGQIDQADRAIVYWLKQRIEAAEEIGRYKQQNGMTIHVPGREAKVRKNISDMCSSLKLGNYRNQILGVAEKIMDMCRGLQEKKTDTPNDDKPEGNLGPGFGGDYR